MEKSSLYKLNKDVLIKIIESGFSVDNLSHEECKDLKKKCKERISKLRTEEMKRCLRGLIDSKDDEMDKRELLYVLDYIDEVCLFKCEIGDDKEIIFYSKDRFEISFDIICHYKNGNLVIQNSNYIGVYDPVEKCMKNKYNEYYENSFNDEIGSVLWNFRHFIIENLNIDEIRRIFCIS